MNKIEKLQKLIDNSNNIVFFGGAGISTESGYTKKKHTYLNLQNTC